jgi:serine/threonine-protein kinase HipA
MAWQISSSGRLERLVVFLGDEARPVGELVFQGAGRLRTSLFRYARTWLENRDARRPLYPVELPLRGKAKDSTPYELPLPLYDAAPDGWGRSVLEVAYPNQVFGLGEFLAASGDNRSGELRFGSDPAAGPEVWVPGDAGIDLPVGTETLEDLAIAAEAMDAGQASGHHLRLLLRASADTGGARPKAHLRHEGGDWIAKFKTWGDGFDNPRMEAVCLSLAKECGIETPPHQFVEVAGRSILLVHRFDRRDDGVRLGYMSASSLVKVPPSTYMTDWTYADVAAAARSAGIAPCEAELFRRMLFNCLIHNTDDHLRNHAFIRDEAGWRLSPVFDIVPNNQPAMVLRPSRDVAATADINVAFGAWPKFLLSEEQAYESRDEVERGTQKLPEMLDRFEVTAKDRDTLAPLLRNRVGSIA